MFLVDAMGNKIVSTKKKAKLSSAELRKKKKERMARRKRGEDVFCKCQHFDSKHIGMVTNINFTADEDD